MSEETQFNPGDTVFHKPSGELWEVAVCDDKDLMPIGWPETIARPSDCVLIKKGPADGRIELLKKLLNMKSDSGRPDWRSVMARRALESTEWKVK